jgi:hypothetical protein
MHSYLLAWPTDSVNNPDLSKKFTGEQSGTAGFTEPGPALLFGDGMKTYLEALREAQIILDRNNIPNDHRIAYITKAAFLLIGGDITDWEDIEGDDDGPKIIRA